VDYNSVADNTGVSSFV